MNGIPDRIHPWDFIGEKFEQIQSTRDANDPCVAEDFEGLILRRERDPVKIDRKPRRKNCEIKIDAGERGQTERDTEEVEPFHEESICAKLINVTSEVELQSNDESQ